MFVGYQEEETMKLLVVYYSMYGHVYQMAKSIAEGAASIEGVNVEIRRVPETLPQEVLETMGALKSLEAQKTVPVCTVSESGERGRNHFRHAHTVRQHVRTDAAIPGCHRRSMGKQRSSRQGWQRLHMLKYSTRRPGVDHPELPYHAAASWNDGGRPALCVSGADDH